MVEIKDLTKIYKTKGEETIALININLNLGNQGFVVLLGKSGSGKSTLLNILGGLDHYDLGEIIIKSKSTMNFKSNEWDSYRNTYVGIVFQEFYIIEEFSVGKNIALALELQGFPKEQIDEKVIEILKQVDLDQFKDRKPSEISGGQKQRIAIARALIKDPQIILADEPTGNLDSETGRLILDSLKELSKSKLIIMVTHDREFAKIYGDRIIELKDGEIISDTINYNQKSEEIIYEVNEKEIKTVIELPNGQSLSQNMIEYLNHLLINEKQDLYLQVTNEEDAKKHIILKNHDNEANPIQLNDFLSKAKNDAFTLKENKMSFKNAFKLAMNSLLTKKIRLLLMSILFIFSLFFMGIALTFSFYDVSKASSLTYSYENTKFIPIEKNWTQTCYEDNCLSYQDNFNIDEVNALNADYSSIHFLPSKIYDVTLSDLVSLQDTDYKSYYKGTNNLGSITFIDLNDQFLKLRYGNYPTNDEEVLITDYMAEVLIYYKAFDVTSIESILGKTLNYNNQMLTISGLVETDYHKYDYLKTIEDLEEIRDTNYDYDQDIKYQKLIMTRDTYEAYFDKVTRRFSFTSINGDSLYHYISVNYLSNVNTNHLIGDSVVPSDENELIVSISALKNIFNEEIDVLRFTEEQINNLLGKDYILEYKTFESFFTNEKIIRNLKLVGVVDDISTEVDYDILLHDTVIEKIRSPYYTQLNITAILDDDNKENTRFFTDLVNKDYKHKTYLSDMLYTLEDITKTSEKYMFITSSVFAVFASVLIFTFISTSIKNKQKDIGTLRAIGARGIDVGTIFMVEGLLIVLFSGIIANILTIVSIRLINHFVVSEIKLKLILLYVNGSSILLVFLFSIIIVFMSTFFPIKRIIKMKPINAIKNIK